MAIFYVDTGSFDNLLVTGSVRVSGSSEFSGSVSISQNLYINGQLVNPSAFGTSGTSGASGTSGTSGATGTSGTSGTSGTTGTSGTGFTTISNAGSARVLTSDGTSNSANAESDLTFSNNKLSINGSQAITGSLTITQNLTVLGSSSIQYVTSSQLNVSNNIISVNSNNPAVRFGGLSVIDSGSSPQRSGSILFDSQNNQFIFVHQSDGSSSPTSSVFIQGPQTFGNIGGETTITQNRLTKGTGGDLGEHIGDSNITDDGTVVSINSSTQITGSLSLTQAVRAPNFVGTSSWASNAVTATTAATASYLVGATILIYTDETDSTITGVTNVSKTYTVPANSYSRLIFESEGEFVSLSNNTTANIIMVVGGSTIRRADFRGTATIGNDITSLKWSGTGLTGGTTVTVTATITAGGNTTLTINSLRVYGVI